MQPYARQQFNSPYLLADELATLPTSINHKFQAYGLEKVEFAST